MIRPVFCALVCVFAVVSANSGACFKKSEHRDELIKSSRPHEVAGFNVASLPTEFDWRAQGTS